MSVPPTAAFFGSICCFSLSVAWLYAVAKRLSIEVQGVELRHVAVRTAVSPILALLGVAVSTIAPVISLVLFVAIPVVYGATAGRSRKNRRNKRQHSG